jgi:putative transposase
VKGRKRHLVVDTLGLLLRVVVHAANISEDEGAKLVFQKLFGVFTRLRLIWADAGYKREIIWWVIAYCPWTLEIIKRPRGAQAFILLPRRWVVERTFAWLGRYRRLSKDYEQLPEVSESWIYLAMIHLMTRRLAHP